VSLRDVVAGGGKYVHKWRSNQDLQVGNTCYV
jgi:hypothetical protein